MIISENQHKTTHPYRSDTPIKDSTSVNVN
jgi:hypothetical protein